MQLKSRQHIACRCIQFAGLWRGVAQAGKLCLKPTDAWQLHGELRLLTRHGLLVRPDSQAFGRQAFPGEQRARVELAHGGDVAMADDMARADALALADVLEQKD